jgi:UDP-glucuronate 4-epimerase
VDIENLEALKLLFEIYQPFDAIINLAARAGVRYSMENPFVYFTTNANGTLNLLELAKDYGIKKFVLASTSSLYAGQPMPFKESLPVNTPISPYAASKKAAEVTCYTYHYLYGIDISIVRYFTVYGPAGRPDMSIFRFIYKIMKGEPIEVFGDGTQSRDFTYVDDIAEGTVRALKPLGYEIINLGGNQPYQLNEVIQIIEELLGKKAKIVYKSFHKADLKATWADINKAKQLLDWEPKVSLQEGLRKTVEWFKKNWNWLKEIEI